MGEVIFTMVHRTSMVLLALCATAHAAKFDFTDTVLSPLMQIARRHAMFTVDDAPSTNGDGKSEVHIDVNFRLREGEVADNLGSDQSIQVIFFHHDELEAVHKADLDGNFCCTIKTDMGYGCPQAGVDSNFVKTYTPIYKTQVDIAPGDGTELLHTVKVEKTGMHYLMYSSCMSDATDVLMTGHNAWLNPYGYLPGELYYNLPFHMVMSGIYVIAGLVWLALIFKHKDDGILPVQWYIGLVVLLGLIEVVTWYITYSTYNTDGRRPVPIMTTAVIFSTIKKTVSRIVVLVVCMGYGIVKPTLGDNAKKVLAFGAVYCVFTTVLDVVKALSHETDISGGFFILVIVPVALLDSIFYYWTFVSLYDVVAHLEERKQTIKLNLYRQFLVVIGVCLIFSLGWVIFQMFFLYSDAFTTQWEYAWVFDAYWYVLSFVVLSAIMALWRPTENSMRYAYTEQLSTNEDDFEGIELDATDSAPAFSIDDEDENELADDNLESIATLDSEFTSPTSLKKTAEDDI